MFSIQTFPHRIPPHILSSNFSPHRIPPQILSSDFFPSQNDSTSLFSVQTFSPPSTELHLTFSTVFNNSTQFFFFFSLTRAQTETHYAVFPAVRVGFPLSDCNGRTLLHAPSYLPDSVCVKPASQQPARAALYRRQHPSPGDAHVLVPFFAERVF